MTDDTLPTATRVLTQRVACDWRRAWAFAADPAHLPEWASGLSKGQFTREGAHWLFEAADGGRARVRFAPPSDFGVLDHWVTPEGGPEIYLPFRVIGLGEGFCEFQFTLLRQPAMDDAAFARDADWIARDLRTLRDLLEAKVVPSAQG